MPLFGRHTRGPAAGDDKQQLRDRPVGNGHDAPSPQPGQRCAELPGGPLHPFGANITYGPDDVPWDAIAQATHLHLGVRPVGTSARREVPDAVVTCD